MSTTTRFVKRVLFLYLLIFGILTWVYRRTVIGKDKLAIRHNNRKLINNIINHGNVPTEGSLTTPNTKGDYYKTGQNDSQSAIRDGNYFRNNSTTSLDLWKSIRLHPEDKRGNEKGRRYGEPLQLYLDPENKISTKSKKWPFVRQPNKLIDCNNLFLEDRNVSERLQWEIIKSMKKMYNESLLKAGISCKEFLRYAGYITEPLTQTETEFPIAYSILMYTDVEQVEILLRTIYRPQNVYCIHIDKTSPRRLHDDVKTVANCFHNVFMTSFSIDVQWGEFTVLEAEMLCLKALWKSKVNWTYFINLTGQDFPLRTNYEIVKILRSFKGANNVEAAGLVTGLHDAKRPLPQSLMKAGLPPFKLTPIFGSTHVVLSREFVDFLLHNETSLAFLNWTRNISIPDEKFFSTMNYNKQLRPPGGYKGNPEISLSNPHLARLKHWFFSSCHGKIVRRICIFGTKDLQLLATREELFANKLHFGYHPEVMLCMQELLYNRTVDEYEGRLEFNVTYYATRNFVKNKF